MCQCCEHYGRLCLQEYCLMNVVAEPPELSRLKRAGHHHKGNTDTNALQTEQFLFYRVVVITNQFKALLQIKTQ